MAKRITLEEHKRRVLLIKQLQEEEAAAKLAKAEAKAEKERQALAEKQAKHDAKFKFHLERAAQYYTDRKVEAFIAEMRRLYAEGALSKWKIERLEQIKGWSW